MTDKPKPPVVEPSKSDEKKRHDAFLDIPLKGAAQLRKKLRWDNNSYHLMHGPNSHDPKGYYLFGVLNEVEKTGMSMMQASEFIVESRVKGIPDGLNDEQQRIADNVLQSRIDELALWQRKMTEIMVDLVGFRLANNKDYYQHYLVLHELKSLQRTQADIKEYYGSENANYAYQEADLIQQADSLAKNLDPNKCWYANISKTGQIQRSLRSLNLRFQAVFPRMKPQQKAVLRTHYVSLGSQSKSLHPGGSAGSRNLSLDDLDLHLSRVGILSLHVVNATKDLMRIHNTNGFLKMCADLVKKNDYPVALHTKKTKPDIEVNDFVVVAGDLAQVTKVIRSRYGYKSFLVKYLEKPPIPSIPEDEFIGELVHLHYKNKKAVADTKALILQTTPEAKPTTQEINKLMREGVVELWSNGMKEITLGRTEEGRKKMAEYLKQQKAKEPPKDGSMPGK
jgi:hypothetical protein